MDQSVLDAIKEGNANKLEKQLKKSGVTTADKLNARFGEKQITYLHEACKYGHVSVIELLLQKGCNIDSQSSTGWTPLHKACAWCHPQAVQTLLTRGPDLSLVTQAINTALHLATQNTRMVYYRDVLRLRGEDLEPHRKDGYSRAFEVVRLLLQHLGAEERGEVVNRRNYAGQTPLHVSAGQGHVHMVALLIENEADLNVKDNCKRRPIDVARQHKRYSVVEYMLEMEIHEERLARQDLARYSTAEHARLEQRLEELAEEHEGELAEQRAQLLQAYKVDQQTQQERLDVRLTAELARKELDVIQLSSLVKAERQNMDNDYSTHGRTIQGLQERLYVINAEKHTLLKNVDELEQNLQQKIKECVDYDTCLATVTKELEELQEVKAVEEQQNRDMINSFNMEHKDKVMEFQQMVDSLQVDVATQSALSDEREAAIDQLKASLGEQEGWVEELRLSLLDRDASIDTLSRSLAERDADAMAQIQERECAIEEMKVQQTGSASRLQEVTEALSKQERNNQGLTSQLDTITKQLQVKESEIEKFRAESEGLGRTFAELKTTLQQNETKYKEILADKEAAVSELQNSSDQVTRQQTDTLTKLKQCEVTIQQLSQEKAGIQQEHEQILSSLKSENQACIGRFEADILKLREENSTIQETHKATLHKQEVQNSASLLELQEKVRSLETENTDIRQQQQDATHTLSTQHKAKLAEFNQKFTEKEKELIIIGTQAKKQAETIKSFEVQQSELKNRHRSELQNLDGQLKQEHQVLFDKLKGDLGKQHQTELQQVTACLQQQHSADIEQHRTELSSKHKQDISEIQLQFTNKQSHLQQEMFRVAGSEQAKLKQQHEQVLSQLTHKHAADLQAKQQQLVSSQQSGDRYKTELETSRQQQELQLQSHRQEVNNVTSQHIQEVSSMTSQHKQEVVALTTNHHNEVEKLQQALQGMNEEVTAMKLRCSEAVRRLAEAGGTHRGEVEGVRGQYTVEVAQFRQDMSVKEEELKSKMAAMTQQDDVIRQYVHENTELKDRCSHIELQLEEQSKQLQKYELMTEESEHRRLKTDMAHTQHNGVDNDDNEDENDLSSPEHNGVDNDDNKGENDVSSPESEEDEIF